MPNRARDRLDHIKDALQQIEKLLAGRSFESLVEDRFAIAAFERFLEIVSEASRHLPEEWKHNHREIPWRRVADLGNRLRHVYVSIDVGLLWDISVADLPALRTAIEAMIAAEDRSR